MSTDRELLREAIDLLRRLEPSKTGNTARMIARRKNDMEYVSWQEDRDALLSRALDAFMHQANPESEDAHQ